MHEYLPSFFLFFGEIKEESTVLEEIIITIMIIVNLFFLDVEIVTVPILDS